MATTTLRRLTGLLLLALLIPTAAIAADTQVATSVIPDIAVNGTLNALNAAATLSPLQGCSGIGMQLDAGTLIGTIVPEVSIDGGATWVASFFDDPTSGNKAASVVFGSSNTATTRTVVGAGGSARARVRVSAFTSGTATAHMRCSAINDPSMLFTGAPASTTQPPLAGQVGGWDGTAFRVFSTDSSGQQLVRLRSPAGTDQGGTTGAAVPPAAVQVGGTDGTNLRAFKTDTTGQLSVTASDATAGPTALGALNATVQVAINGQQGAGVLFSSGLVGTVVAELSMDGGTTWSGTQFYQTDTGNYFTSITNPAASTQRAIKVIGGAGLLRIRVQAYTSGSCNATLRATAAYTPNAGYEQAVNGTAPLTVAQVGGSDGTAVRPFTVDTSGRPMVVGNIGDGSAAAGNPVTIAGWDATNVHRLLTDTTGRLQVSGAAANGSAVAGNPVLMAGSAAGTTKSLITNSNAALKSVPSDGTNDVAVKAASTAAVAADPALAVTLSPNSPLPTGSNALGSVTVTGTTTISGTVNQGPTPASVANAWPFKITDTTNTAAVKAASTAPAAADPALVVSVSPNSAGLTDSTTSSTALGALNATIQIATAGQQGAGFTLAAGTLAATLVPEVSYDGGTTWSLAYFYDPTNGTISGSPAFTNPNAAKQYGIITGPGVSHARVRVLLYTSGTANATLRASQTAPASSLMVLRDPGGGVVTGAIGDSSGRMVVVGANADTGAATGNPLRVAGMDFSSNLHTLTTDTAGHLQTSASSSGTPDFNVLTNVIGKRTYYASTNTTTVGTTTGASIFYIFHVSGTSGDYRINRIRMSYGGGAGTGTVTFAINRISVVGTGGTAVTAETANLGDSATAATLTFKATGAPTRSSTDLDDTCTFVATSTGTCTWDPGIKDAKAITMRSAQNEGIEIRLITAGTVSTGPFVGIYIEWNEG